MGDKNFNYVRLCNNWALIDPSKPVLYWKPLSVRWSKKRNPDNVASSRWPCPVLVVSQLQRRQDFSPPRLSTKQRSAIQLFPQRSVCEECNFFSNFTQVRSCSPQNKWCMSRKTFITSALKTIRHRFVDKGRLRD